MLVFCAGVRWLRFSWFLGLKVSVAVGTLLRTGQPDTLRHAGRLQLHLGLNPHQWSEGKWLTYTPRNRCGWCIQGVESFFIYRCCGLPAYLLDHLYTVITPDVITLCTVFFSVTNSKHFKNYFYYSTYISAGTCCMYKIAIDFISACPWCNDCDGKQTSVVRITIPRGALTTLFKSSFREFTALPTAVIKSNCTVSLCYYLCKLKADVASF